MMPQMSVLPSRPLATNTSGGSQPVAFSSADVRLLQLADAACRRRRGAARGPGPGPRATVGVDEVLAVRRELDGVVAVALGQGDQAGAVEVDAVVVDEVGVLARVLAAGPEPDLPLLLVDAVDAADDVLALGDLVLDLARPSRRSGRGAASRRARRRR